jgi:HlyD family secretion protein
MKAKPVLMVMIPLVLVVGAAGMVWRLFSPPTLPEGILEGHGRIEGTEITVGSKVTGRILNMPVSEGDFVEKGAMIAVIEAEETEARLVQADARVQAAEKQVKELTTRVETLAHHLATARVDHQRAQVLFRERAISSQQFDMSENALKAAEGEFTAVQALLAAAKAEVTAARALRDEVQIALSDTRITAPIVGTVVTKAAEEGELVFPGRILAVLVDLTRPYLRVYLPEKEIGKVKLGDPARVYVDSFPNRPFEAVVTEVGKKAEFTPKDVHMPDERVTLVYSVKLEIKNPQRFLKPGMPADALIRWQPEAVLER